MDARNTSELQAFGRWLHSPKGERSLAAAAILLLLVQSFVLASPSSSGPEISAVPEAAASVPASPPAVTQAPSAEPTLEALASGSDEPDADEDPGQPATAVTDIDENDPTPTLGAPTPSGGESAAAKPKPAAPKPTQTKKPQPQPTQTKPPPPPPPPSDPARARFEQRFPAQAGAGQDIYAPATTRWALLIGINEHSGRTRDNLGSRQDAEDLHAHLKGQGWRDDHMVLLTDAVASRENIEQGIAWLARKTNADSAAVFHYSGHTKQWPGEDRDGDGERTDEALWPSDNNKILDSDFVAMMANVNAGKMWLNFGACEAEGYADPGLARAGRVITMSSREDEKSYEDPNVGNSVWGYYMVEQAMQRGRADFNGDGDVTVEEAFTYAQPRAASRTDGQKYGAQHPVTIDMFDGHFSLRMPPAPPRPKPSPKPSPSPSPKPTPDCGLPICGPTARLQRV